MFKLDCPSCEKTQLIFPSQVRSLVNTTHGIEAAVTCWCGADQVVLTGRRTAERLKGRAGVAA